MDATKCEAILIAAETGSLTAAAERLGYTQSGITRMLGSLENEVGFSLFVRSKGFAAGCSREVIERGAEQLGWELEKLLTMTLQAMAESEDTIQAEMALEE